MIKEYTKNLFLFTAIISSSSYIFSPTNMLADPSMGKRVLGIDESSINKSADPCVDFYEYACGSWVSNTTLPDDESSWVKSFDGIDKQNKNFLKEILENYPTKEPYAKKATDYYTTCMNEEISSKHGITWLQKRISDIRLVKTKQDLANITAKLHLESIHSLFEVAVSQDLKDSTKYVLHISQGGLTLPDREYYIQNTPKFEKIRTAYKDYMATTFKLAGIEKSKIDSMVKTVFNIETSLAEASLKREELRDADKLHHPKTKKELSDLVPNFLWSDYFAKIGRADINYVNMQTPKFFDKLNALLATTSSSDLQTYMLWRNIYNSSNFIGKNFEDERFKFNQAFSGAKKQKPRWEKCLLKEIDDLGYALSIPFVKKTFGEHGKAESKKMLSNIKESFRKNLEQIEWMDEVTKKAANSKLEKMAEKIGYPDIWFKYDGLTIGTSSWIENITQSNIFISKYQLNKIGKQIDKTEWDIPPAIVNAYYNPLMNEMVFPAGILQPPFFSDEQSLAENYGAIGLVIGHELGHGFDDEGRQFDAEGNLRDWWSEATSSIYKTKAQCVIDQYAKYEVLDGLYLNGKLTLGENIADISGLKLSYNAFQIAKKQSSDASSKVLISKNSAFSPDQEFFISFAQSWCGKYREEKTRMLVVVDPHSPSKFRVNGSVSNLPEFQSAFQCKSGQPMAPEKRCSVW